MFHVYNEILRVKDYQDWNSSRNSSEKTVSFFMYKIYTPSSHKIC